MVIYDSKGKIIKSSNNNSNFELADNTEYNPFFKGTHKPNSFYWAGYWIDKSTPWIVFVSDVNTGNITVKDTFTTEEEAKQFANKLKNSGEQYVEYDYGDRDDENVYSAKENKMRTPKNVYLNEDTQKLIQRLEKRVGHELKLQFEEGNTPYVEIEKLPKGGYSFITKNYLNNLAEHFLYDGYKEKQDSFIVYLDPAIMYTESSIKSVYTRPDSERYDKYGYFNPYTPTADELLKTDEIKKVLSEELSKAYEPDPMDDYVGYDSTNERIDTVIEKVAKQFNVDTDYVDELAGKIQKEEYARTMTEDEWVYEHCNDKDKFWAWQNGEDISLEELGIDKEQMDKEVDEAVRKYVNSSKSIKSSRKPIKSSYEEAFTVYPWDPNQVTGTSDEDLGLSYVVEAYGDEFVNVDEDTLNDIKDTLVQYFDDEAYVRDWNINYPNDQIEDAFDIVDPETMEVDDLAQYFDYEAYGRDIRLNKRMVWDSEEECWVSASDINDEDLDDSKYIWIGSSKQQIRSERASQTVDKHSAEDLELYAENTAEVYERFITPVVKNLRRKVKKGIYDEDKALIAWQNVIDEAAKMYDKEQGSGKGSLTMFNKATRNEAAKGLMERMSDDVFQEE